MIKDEKRTRLVLIDGPNLSGMEREIKVRLDKIKLFERLTEKGDYIFYYYRPPETTENNNQEDPFLHYLDFLHNRLWRVLAKKGVCLVCFPTTKGEEDAMIITDTAIATLKKEWLGIKDNIKEIVLISGDGIFAEILRLTKDKNIKISVLAGKESCAKELTEVADEVNYIQDLVQSHPEIALES